MKTIVVESAERNFGIFVMPDANKFASMQIQNINRNFLFSEKNIIS